MTHSQWFLIIFPLVGSLSIGVFFYFHYGYQYDDIERIKRWLETIAVHQRRKA